MPIEVHSPAVAAGDAVAPKRSAPFAARAPKPTTRDRIFFTERLSLLLHTGMPLHASLATLEEQAANPAMAEAIGGLRGDVEAGLSFAQALSKQGEVFPGAYASLVAAGESGGFLPLLLERLQEMDERREELRSTLFSSLSYPAFLVLFSVAVVVFVLVVVFPKFGDLFTMIRDQLPITTVVLMAASDLLRSYWLPLLGGLAAAAVVGGRWAKSPPGVVALDRLFLRLPLVREIIVQLQLVQFLHVMSLSLGNGVSIVDALRSCRDTIKSPTFRGFVDDLEARVSAGEEFAAGFREAGFLPVLARQTVDTGERTGNLALVMGRLAAFYEREWKRRLQAISKVVEPAMLVFMGGVVGLIVSSLILPIFKLSRAVH